MDWNVFMIMAGIIIMVAGFAVSYMMAEYFFGGMVMAFAGIIILLAGIAMSGGKKES